MAESWSHSERVLVLAPIGRDAAIASAILSEAGIAAESVANLASCSTRSTAASARRSSPRRPSAPPTSTALSAWLDRQPAWSDLPIIVLTHHGGGPERNPARPGSPASWAT